MIVELRPETSTKSLTILSTVFFKLLSFTVMSLISREIEAETNLKKVLSAQSRELFSF
jgi:hypothetical protein